MLFTSSDATDQRKLKELVAVEKLINLVQSKHVLIAQGSSGALQNLLRVSADNLLPLSPADAKKKLPLQVNSVGFFQTQSKFLVKCPKNFK